MSALAGNAEEDLAPGSNPDEAELCGRAGAVHARRPKEGEARRRGRGEAESLAAEFAEEDGCDEEDQDIEMEDRSGSKDNQRRSRRPRVSWTFVLETSIAGWLLESDLLTCHAVLVGSFSRPCTRRILHCLDQMAVYDDTKYAWLQGRQVYLLSRLYNESAVETGKKHGTLRKQRQLAACCS